MMTPWPAEHEPTCVIGMVGHLSLILSLFPFALMGHAVSTLRGILMFHLQVIPPTVFSSLHRQCLSFAICGHKVSY